MDIVFTDRVFELIEMHVNLSLYVGLLFKHPTIEFISFNSMSLLIPYSFINWLLLYTGLYLCQIIFGISESSTVFISSMTVLKFSLKKRRPICICNNVLSTKHY